MTVSNSKTDTPKRAELEKIILEWSSEITGEPRERLAPDALTLLDRLLEWHEQEIAEATKPYHELLYTVGNKFEGETRHETALRYIKMAENQDNPPAEALKEQTK